MRKMFVVAIREYQAAVRSKAFIISLVAMPVMWGGSIAAQAFLGEKVDTADKRIAILDRTAKLYDGLAAAAEWRNTHTIFKGDGESRRQVKPRFILERVDPADAGPPPQSTLKLSDRVRNQEIFAFIEIGPQVLTADAPPGQPAIAYHSDSPTYEHFRHWIIPLLNNLISELRATEAGLDLTVVSRVIQPVPMENLGLVSQDASGNITEAEKINELANLFVPVGMMMLMFVGVFVGASPLLQNVLEEKMARIAEVLLGSVRPFPLMMGKLIGTVGVSLTIVCVYMVGGYSALDYAGYAKFFPGHLIVWFILFQSLAVLMYGSIFSAIGAAVSDFKEAQSITFPVMLIAMLPMFVWVNVMKEPSSTFSLALSLFPPATPMLMLMRQAVPPGIPIWQPLLGVLLVLLTTTACVYASGRIFRVGILMQGKGANLGQMLRWVFRG